MLTCLFCHQPKDWPASPACSNRGWHQPKRCPVCNDWLGLIFDHPLLKDCALCGKCRRWWPLAADDRPS